MYRILLLAFVAFLTACASVPARVPFETTAAVSQSPYYVLRERPAAIIEVDAERGRAQHIYDLESATFKNRAPEGLTFVPNADVRAYGLFDLPESAYGGYFLVSSQRDGRVHIFDVPLGRGGQPQEKVIVIIPGLEDDASALYYAEGFIWIVSGAHQRLYKVSTITIGDSVAVEAVYSFTDLPFRPADIEGITFKEPGVVFLADDQAHEITRYDNFPDCLAASNCQRTWQRYVGDAEPSGAAWDSKQERLLIVGDEGEFFSLDADGENLATIWLSGFDLEGVTVVP